MALYKIFLTPEIKNDKIKAFEKLLENVKNNKLPKFLSKYYDAPEFILETEMEFLESDNTISIYENNVNANPDGFARLLKNYAKDGEMFSYYHNSSDPYEDGFYAVIYNKEKYYSAFHPLSWPKTIIRNKIIEMKSHRHPDIVRNKVRCEEAIYWEGYMDAIKIFEGES